MGSAIYFSVLYLMPILSYTFMILLINILRRDQKLKFDDYVCAICFAVMMWTIGGAIVIVGG